MNGLWALDRQDTPVDSLFWGDNLEAWGWLYLIVGVVLVVIGVFIFRRAAWAVLAGVGACSRRDGEPPRSSAIRSSASSPSRSICWPSTG